MRLVLNDHIAHRDNFLPKIETMKGEKVADFSYIYIMLLELTD